ncbi:MAG: universal stress protein [Anaerolineales bacterium]
MKKSLIVFTNGREETWPAVEYAAWLAAASGTPLTLVGVVERAARREAVESMLARGQALAGGRVSCDVRVEEGIMDEVIIRAGAHDADAMLVFGPYRRVSIRQWLFGDSFRNVMANVAAPILHVPRAVLPPKNILVCVGGLGYTVPAEALGVEIAALSKAQLSLLHVVPPINLDYPTARQVSAHVDDLLESDTPPGRAMRQAVRLARDAGLNPSVRICQGHILDEIRAEIQRGRYDLVCMGSTYSAHGLRHLTAPNITAEVAHSANCAVLSARFVETGDD